MSKKGGKAPKAPDYSSLAKQDADAQQRVAEQLTAANRPTQVDAYGNRIDWSQDPTTKAWTQTSTLNPTLKGANEGIQGGFADAISALRNQGSFQAPDTLGYSFAPGSVSGSSGGGGGGASMPNMTFDPLSTFQNKGFGKIGEFDKTQGDKVAQDMYASVLMRALPEQQRAQQGLDVQLRQQGLQPGTEAYDRAYKNMLTAHGDVDAKAALDATQAGYAAAGDIYNTNLAGQAQRFGQGLSTWEAEAQRQKQLGDQQLGKGQIGASLAATNASRAAANQQFELGKARQIAADQQQRYSQALQQYGMTADKANMYGNMMGSLPGGQFPGFSSATGYNPASMSNAAQSGFEANMGQYNAGQGKKGNTTNAAAGLGGAAMMAFSDQDLKTNIEPLEGEAALATLLELGGYEYDWKDGSGHDMGVIAQEVEKVLPNLVERVETGNLAVRYQGLVALAIESIKYLAGELQHGR